MPHRIFPSLGRLRLGDMRVFRSGSRSSPWLWKSDRRRLHRVSGDVVGALCPRQLC